MQQSLGYGGFSALGITQTQPGQAAERAPGDFVGYAQMFATNPVVWACMVARQAVFSAPRFQWQRLKFSGHRRDGISVSGATDTLTKHGSKFLLRLLRCPTVVKASKIGAEYENLGGHHHTHRIKF